jgi:protocatechuate 3,4-dioxygenase beta subunit
MRVLHGLRIPATVLGAGLLAACGSSGATSSAAAPTTTPTAAAACTAVLTPALTEGPYFKGGSPQRTDLTSGAAGRPLAITGVVRSATCAPVANAKLDFWQADGNGRYDNSGYRLRGHVFTDRTGRFTIQTVVPGLYPGRTRHIHVKVKAPKGPVLTTQLYFPGEARNSSDGLFNPRTTLTITRRGARWAATYSFAVRAA